DEHGPMIVVQSRDQREVIVLSVDPSTRETSALSTDSDEAWVALVGGVPRRLADGRVVTVGAYGDAVALLVDGQPVTRPDMEVRAVLTVAEEEALFTASTEPIEVHVWRWDTTGALSRLTTAPGVHAAASGGGVHVLGSSRMEHDGMRWTLGDHVFESRAEPPVLTPSVQPLT